jgi:CubicO group peptidase (beta-lactamase class C family)
LATIDVESDIDWKIIRSPLNARRTRVPNCDSGGGGLFASVNDFAKYLAMIANGGKLNGVRVLSEESMQLHLRDQTTKMLPEAFRRGFGDDASSYMKFAAGFGRKMDVNKDTNSESVDYFFWGGAANTFFWVDVDNGTIGVFATQLAPSLYNFSNTIEEIVDQAQIK